MQSSGFDILVPPPRRRSRSIPHALPIEAAQTGGHAKIIVDEEMVTRNGELELRKRAKLISGDTIEVENFVINLV